MQSIAVLQSLTSSYGMPVAASLAGAAAGVVAIYRYGRKLERRTRDWALQADHATRRDAG